jgi:hypothetical protein
VEQTNITHTNGDFNGNCTNFIDPNKLYRVPTSPPWTQTIPVYPAPVAPGICPGCGRCKECGRPAGPQVTITYNTSSSK